MENIIKNFQSLGVRVSLAVLALVVGFGITLPGYTDELPRIYISSSSGVNPPVFPFAFKDEDILQYDGTTGWAMHFDGSDVGLGGNVDDFHINADDGTILLSITSDTTFPTLPGMGSNVFVDDSDILLFTPADTCPSSSTPPLCFGSYTAGTFEMYFDGSAVGLGNSSEDIDAMGFAPDGRLVVSTTGAFSVPGPTGATVSGRDEDLIVFNAGSDTWELYFDGSDVGLGNSDEDVNGIAIASNGDIYLTNHGFYSVPAGSGDANDIFLCTPGTTPPEYAGVTTCTYAPVWDPSAVGLPATINGHLFDVDGIDLDFAP